MLENFHLVTIAKTGSVMRLYQIPLHQDLQDTLAENWQLQLDAFMVDIQEIDFDAGYVPEYHECFRLNDFELPLWFHGQSSETVGNLDSISRHENMMGAITGLAAFARNDRREELILFQNFSRGHVIKHGHSLLLSGNTYGTVTHPGLMLGNDISAVFTAADRKLLFQNFRTTNTFLPLGSFYREASAQDIREVLSHDRLDAEDVEALATGANQWFRKRFAMLRDSEILDNFDAVQIKAHSDGFEVDVRIRNNRIVFPADKVAAKRLLQFLNEELFRGPITETLYETNSKREAD